jgi:hypothetical protein
MEFQGASTLWLSVIWGIGMIIVGVFILSGF